MYVTHDKRKTAKRKLNRPPLRINSGIIELLGTVVAIGQSVGGSERLDSCFHSCFNTVVFLKWRKALETYTAYNKTSGFVCCLAQVAPEHPGARALFRDKRRLCTSFMPHSVQCTLTSPHPTCPPGRSTFAQ